jgi:hypothetical protein
LPFRWERLDTVAPVAGFAGCVGDGDDEKLIFAAAIDERIRKTIEAISMQFVLVGGQWIERKSAGVFFDFDEGINGRGEKLLAEADNPAVIPARRVLKFGLSLFVENGSHQGLDCSEWRMRSTASRQSEALDWPRSNESRRAWISAAQSFSASGL